MDKKNMTESKRSEKFNGQNIIFGHRIKEIGPDFYEMLERTYYIHSPHEIKLVHSWADYIKKKDVPFVVTKLKSETDKPNSYCHTMHFWIKGIKKVPPRYVPTVK